MTELIIHIGTFKTGTTALQKYMSAQRDRLLTESGLLFPKSGEIPAGGHHNLVYEVTGSWKYVAARGGFADLEREISQTSPESVLISAENLSSYAVGNEGVAPHFAGFAKRLEMPVKVVCWVRPQWEYMDSYYSQGVKSGYTTCSFASFVESALKEDIYDYEKVVAPWNPFATEIVVRPYPGSQLIADACRIFGVGELRSEDGVSAERKNIRFGAKRLEFMRRVGAALERTKAPFKRRIPVAHRLRDAIMAADLDDVRFSGLDSSDVKRIAEHFLESNRRLSDRFGMGSDWYAVPQSAFRPTIFSMADADEGDIRVFEDVLVRALLDKDNV